MKRTAIVFSLLVLALSLSIVSCDQMFSTNLFTKLTHPTPSAADISAKSPSQLKTYMDSTANVDILVQNPDLKAAALASLEATYDPLSGASALDKQTAAVVAADISIQTVPEAASLSSTILGALLGGTAVPTTEGEVAPFVTAILPADIASSIGDPTPPAGFTAIITAFLDANAAYSALGTQVNTSGGFVAGSALSSDETANIAVNAAISALIAAIVPANPAQSTAQALWDSLNGNLSAITVPTIGTITSAGHIDSLISASSLGSLLGGL